jgi:hypothetical protein
MTVISFFPIPCNVILQFAIIFLIVLNPGCSILSQPIHFDFQSNAPDRDSASACIKVHGKVLGAITPNSKVFLFQTPSLNYSIVMRTVRNGYPIGCTYVNQSQGFAFDCLPTGMYAFVVPTASYNGFVGSPLPYEFDCPNVSIKIAFQGGDMHYAVGAFSIEKPQNRSDSDCNDNPFLCRTIRGSLYRKCPLEGK